MQQHEQKGKRYASYSNYFGPDCSGRLAMAGESIHSHGRKYQVHFERSCNNLRGGVAVECIWIAPLAIANSRRIALAQSEPKKT